MGTPSTVGGPPPQGQTLGPVGPAPGINQPTMAPSGTPGLPGSSGLQGNSLSQASGAVAKKPKPLPKSPPQEPAMTKEVKGARKRKTAVLKERQNREVQGKMRGGPRDVDAGAGFWPPLSPLL